MNKMRHINKNNTIRLWYLIFSTKIKSPHDVFVLLMIKKKFVIFHGKWKQNQLCNYNDTVSRLEYDTSNMVFGLIVFIME